MPYSLILVAAPIDPAILAQIQTHATALQIPTFYFHFVGYFSSFSVLLPSAFPIVDTHPDPETITDLRLLTPWPALSEFAKEKTERLGTQAMSPQDKAHIPWVAIVLHYLEVWKKQHNGKVPQNYSEKKEFQKLVRAGDPQEENFDEACAAVLKALNPHKVGSDVKEILEAPEAKNLTATSPSFWVIANAIGQFVAETGELPLPGGVPDMKAQSADYIKLQNIYKTKARRDCAEVVVFVRELERETQRPVEMMIDEREIENFCKGAAHIHLVRGRPLQIAEAGKPTAFNDPKSLAFELSNPDSLLPLHIAFLAWDEFVATRPDGTSSLHMPGSTDQYAADTDKVTGIAHVIADKLVTDATSGAFLPDPDYSALQKRITCFCKELVRAGGAELHNIASLTGGLLSQEVIKVITRQYVPVDNTCLFDGVASKTHVLKL
jgi:NEDD8-activating enzyme E1 regulatory subunit